MSTNQNHGIIFENYIKSAFYIPRSEGWDLEKECDLIDKLPTSIKTVKNTSSTIDLADARRFWNLNEPFRLLVGSYYQNNQYKDFYLLTEYIISVEEHKILLGNIAYNEIELFHEELKSFKIGEHLLARKFAQEKLNILKNRSKITLNPKIDSKSQRRLQCSITLNKLNQVVNNKTVYNKSDFYRELAVDFSIASSSREFYQEAYIIRKSASLFQ